LRRNNPRVCGIFWAALTRQFTSFLCGLVCLAAAAVLIAAIVAMVRLVF
jgi:hypothetical protein